MSDFDEMMENADFAQDDDIHNMYPHSDGFYYNYPENGEEDTLRKMEELTLKNIERDLEEVEDPVNDWERDHFFSADEPNDDFPIDPIEHN